jgi:hypothetical protein
MKAKSDLTKKVHAFYNDKNERVQTADYWEPYYVHSYTM